MIIVLRFYAFVTQGMDYYGIFDIIIPNKTLLEKLRIAYNNLRPAFKFKSNHQK